MLLLSYTRKSVTRNLGLSYGTSIAHYIGSRVRPLRWSDVAYDPDDTALKVRREMEATFGKAVSWVAVGCVIVRVTMAYDEVSLNH